MEASKRVNYRLIEICQIDVKDGQVWVYYGVAPFYWKRLAVYQLQEIVQHILNSNSQKANNLDFLMDHFSEIMIDEVCEFHFAQCAISFKKTLENLRNELSFLRKKIQKRITK